MRCWWIASLGLIACGGTTKPERLPDVPHTLPAQQQQPPPAGKPALVEDLASIDESLDARWDELEITGANWTEQVETIPAHLRTLMATRLLQQGDFVCDTVGLPDPACRRSAVQRLPSSKSTLADPCLRRQLALWALDQIEDEAALLELRYELTELVILPEPENELPAAAIDKLPDGYLKAAALWDAKNAGHIELVNARVLDVLGQADLRMAANDLHLDAAVLALDPDDDVDILVRAVDDDALTTATRMQVIDRLAGAFSELGSERREDVSDRLHSATRDNDCTIAAAATTALAEIGEGKRQVPAGPFATEEAVISAACARLAMDERGLPWKQLISKHALTVVNAREDPFRVDALWTRYPFAYDDDEDGVPDVPDADPDGDGDAATTREERTAPWTKRFTLPYADELRLALPHCDGLDCAVPDTNIWFHLDIRKERGTKLRLQGIERHERVGSDC